MKYLLTATIILIGLMFPQITLSEHEKRQKVWTNGDLITTRVLCKTEDGYLRINKRRHERSRNISYDGDWNFSGR